MAYSTRWEPATSPSTTSLTGLPRSARKHDIVPDRLRGDHRAAGAVDAKQDGAHLWDREIRQRHEVVRSGARLDLPPFPPTLTTGRPHRRRARSVPSRRSARSFRPGGADAFVPVRGQVDRPTSSACPDPAPLVGSGDDVVAISEAVDERCPKRFVGEQRPAVDRRPHRIRRQLAGLGDAVHDLSGHREGEQIFDLLAMRRGVILVSVSDVGPCRLVKLAAMV